MISQGRLNELFNYDPSTGVLTRKVSRRRWKAGSVVGTKDKIGYIIICADYQVLRAHRAIFMMVHGYVPDEIDHINGNKSDNRMANLRPATHAMNQQNRMSAAKNSKSGILGVKLVAKSGRWLASIRYNGKTVHIGSFADSAEAHNAYLETKRKIHEGCTI